MTVPRDGAVGEKRFGRYQVIERIGVGAMGAVYRARDGSLGREVAVKTIHTIGQSEFQLEMFNARFDNEARAVAALSHPHIVNVFDVGVEDGTPFLVMELAEGRSLAERLEQQGPLDGNEVRALGLQMAGALGAAHAQGIVHRDVKPANILEAEPGVWKLADFGIAHVPDSSLTLAGQFLGSPAYAAPESLERGAFGHASDIYSLGATLYEALTGEPPYGTGGLLTVGALAADSAPQPLAELCPTLPADVGFGIMRALARQPEQRLSAEQFATALRGESLPPAVVRPIPVAPAHVVVAPVPPSRRRATAIAIAAAILIVGIGLGVSMSSSDDEPESKPGPQPVTAPPPADARRPAGTRVQDTRGARRFPPSAKTIRHNEKQWRKVDKKLREGKERDAIRHLHEILRRDPENARARELYQRLSGREWSNEDRVHKKRGHRGRGRH